MVGRLAATPKRKTYMLARHEGTCYGMPPLWVNALAYGFYVFGVPGDRPSNLLPYRISNIWATAGFTKNLLPYRILKFRAPGGRKSICYAKFNVFRLNRFRVPLQHMVFAPEISPMQLCQILREKLQKFASNSIYKDVIGCSASFCHCSEMQYKDYGLMD